MEFINIDRRNYTFTYSDGTEETIYNCVDFSDGIKKGEEIGLSFDIDFKVSSVKSTLFIKSKSGMMKSKFVENFAMKHGYEYIDIRVSE